MVTLLFAQLNHAIGLNDVCDALRHHAAKLFIIGVTVGGPWRMCSQPEQAYLVLAPWSCGTAQGISSPNAYFQF